MQEIRTIVITGGPCAGKTTAMSWIQNACSAKGYKVLFVPETATELITGGVAPWTCGTNQEYQVVQMRLQMQKEENFIEAAKTMPEEKILIVCDRGELDNKAYMNDEEYAYVLGRLNMKEDELLQRYDAVFHLVTAADGAEEFYTTANNEARIETVSEAIALDQKLISCWRNHPSLCVIDNDRDFDAKMQRLISEIYDFLGEEETYTERRRYLVELSEHAFEEELRGMQKMDIVMIALKGEDGEERFAHQREINGAYTCYRSSRKQIGEKAISMEKRLSENEYFNALLEADETMFPIHKTRHRFSADRCIYDIDQYEDGTVIAEVRLPQGIENFCFPEWITVKKDITDDPQYENMAIAKRGQAAVKEL